MYAFNMLESYKGFDFQVNSEEKWECSQKYIAIVRPIVTCGTAIKTGKTELSKPDREVENLQKSAWFNGDMPTSIPRSPCEIDFNPSAHTDTAGESYFQNVREYQLDILPIPYPKL